MQDDEKHEQDVPIQENEAEGLIVVPEENIVIEEESMVESETESISEQDEDSYTSTVEEDVIVADIEDNVTPDETVQHSRPRRANAGAGVERL